MRMLSPISTTWSWPRRSLSPIQMGDAFEEFDQIVESFLRPTLATSHNFQPSCDVSETKDHYLISFDMPGVKKEDVKIEVKRNQLFVSGERHRATKEEDETTLRHERSYGRFERSFTLPESVAADKIEAHYENGVLNVALPKAEIAQGRTIPIQTGKSGFLSQLLGSKKDSSPEMKDVKHS
ncbi:MAG: Hsp20/alpha crystallin family protein [Bdellovibrionales bacterium]|nr:Hsp20/alpha crystallin family protein [Bdellovibrionales bacterium]